MVSDKPLAKNELVNSRASGPVAARISRLHQPGVVSQDRVSAVPAGVHSRSRDRSRPSTGAGQNGFPG
jgi:hypothetical protein